MERNIPDVPEPRAPDKSDDDSQPDDESQPRAPDKPDDDSQSVLLIKKKWISVPLEDDNMRWLGAVRVRPEDHSPRHIQDGIKHRQKKWTFVPLEDDTMRWLGAVRVRPEDHSPRKSQHAFQYRYLDMPMCLGVSEKHTTTEITETIHHFGQPIKKLSNQSRDQTVSGIGKMETEKPVAVWHPVPPAPPPPNPPI